MPVNEETVSVGRAPQEVFDYISRPENLPVWDSSILEAEQIGSDPLQVGTRWRGASKILGRRFDWTVELVELRPPTRMTSRSVEGKVSFTVTYTLEPDGGGTRLTYRVESGSGLGGVFGRLADPMVEKAHSRTVRANLGTLAELLEQGPEA